ncbi:MAG: hypothetical protein KDD60_12640, partial [Bdellovibrionales bacterium]|nr:hypothetical protein [Bdellovibrionales bacterium]
LVPADVTSIISEMAAACREEDCTLVGGETSEQPRVLPGGTYILSAACIGVVDKSRIITGEHVQSGDHIWGVASNGVHTNGYTLVRSLLEAQPELAEQSVGGQSFLDAILLPHLCYNTPLQEIFSKNSIHGLAHITGGGIRDNFARILPDSVGAEIRLENVPVPEVFKFIYQKGSVPLNDMLRTFNCGVGMIFVASPDEGKSAAKTFNKHGFTTFQLGTIENGDGSVELSGNLAL